MPFPPRPLAIIFAYLDKDGIPYWLWYFVRDRKLITELRNYGGYLD